MLIIYFIGSLFLAGLLFLNRNKIVNYILVSLFVILHWAFAVFEFNNIGLEELGYFKSNHLGIVFLIVLSILSVSTLYHSIIDFKENGEDPRERSIYYAALIILIMTLSGAYLSSHLVVTWIFVEITTLSASVLIYHRRTELALEATWKYLFVCSVSLTLSFIGILFLSIAIQHSGSIDLSFSSLMNYARNLNNNWLKISFLFILIGFSTKMGLFPMNTVTIDAHSVAPPQISAFISTVLMNVGFIAIFRIYKVMAQTNIIQWVNFVLLLSGILSIFTATIYSLKVIHHKRMFAYSSLEHMGIVAIGVASGGIGYYGVILHLIFHSFTKASLFYQISQVFHVFKSYKIAKTGNYFNLNPIGGVVIILGFLCITAIPPSGLFISEFLVFRALYESGFIVPLVLVLFLLTIITWAVAKNILHLLFGAPEGFNSENIVKISPFESISQFILLGLVIYLGVNPPGYFVQFIANSVSYILP
jgi:hydrogenase-4 component F